MPKGGTLNLKAYAHMNDVVLEIRDTGIGIPEDMKIFEPFATTKAAGSGLGMYVSNKLFWHTMGRLFTEARCEKEPLFESRYPNA